MFKDAFKKLEKNEIEEVLPHINDNLDGFNFSESNVTILSYDLPFYKGYRFMEIADHGSLPNNKRFVIYKDQNVTVLDGRNETLYALNKDAPLELATGTAADYLRFFFTYTKGEKGHFMVIEGAEDIPWKEEPPASARKAISEIITPIVVRETGAAITASICFLFKGSLFQARADIDLKGQIALSEEKLLIENMPVFNDYLDR